MHTAYDKRITPTDSAPHHIHLNPKQITNLQLLALVDKHDATLLQQLINGQSHRPPAMPALENQDTINLLIQLILFYVNSQRTDWLSAHPFDKYSNTRNADTIKAIAYLHQYQTTGYTALNFLERTHNNVVYLDRFTSTDSYVTNQQFDQLFKQRHIEIGRLKQSLAIARERLSTTQIKLYKTILRSKKSHKKRYQLQTELQQLRESSERFRKITEKNNARLLKQRFDLETSLQHLQKRLNRDKSIEQMQIVILQRSLVDMQDQLLQTRELQSEREMELKVALSEADNRAEMQVEALYGEIEQLHKDQDTLKRELEANRQHLAEKEEENQVQLAKLEAEHGQRELELQTKLDEANRSASDNLAHAKAEITALQQQIKAKESSRQQLQREKAVLANSLQTETANALKYVEHAESLYQQMQRLEAELNTTKQANNNTRHQHDEVIVAVEKERQQHLTTIEELKQAIEAEKQYTKDEQARLEAVIEEVNQKLQATRAEAQQQLDEARQQALAGSQILLGRMNKVIEAEKQTARNEQARLKSVIKALNQQLETTRDDTQRQVENDSQELQDRKIQALEQALEDEKQSTKEEKARTKTVIKGLKEQLKAIRAEAHKQRDRRIEQEALMEQEYLTIKDLRHRLTATKTTLNNSNKRIAEIERAHQETLSELQKELESNENAWSKVADSEVEVQTAKQEAASLRIELEEEITNLRAQLEHQQERSDTTLDQHLKENDQLKQSVSKMQAELKMADSIIRLLKENKNAKSKTKSQFEEQLSKLQMETKIKQAELSASIDSERKEKESLSQQLEIAKAQSENPGALQRAKEEIRMLKRKIKGMREVQLEMESHVTVEKNEDTRKLLKDLKTTQAKLKQTEKLAQRSKVLLKENQVHESAIDLLSEELDALTKEKELLIQERDELTNELSDIKDHYIKLAGEHGRLH